MVYNIEGKNNILTSKAYQFIPKGIGNYSLGWYNTYENEKDFLTHAETAGTYYTLIAIDRKKKMACIIFTNPFNEAAINSVRQLMRRLKANYYC